MFFHYFIENFLLAFNFKKNIEPKQIKLTRLKPTLVALIIYRGKNTNITSSKYQGKVR